VGAVGSLRIEEREAAMVETFSPIWNLPPVGARKSKAVLPIQPIHRLAHCHG
jgi:hypothetical protein